MDSVDKDDKREDTLINHENTLKLRGENACQGVSMSQRKGRERLPATVVFLAAGRVEPKEGRGLGVNDIAIRTRRYYIKEKVRG